MKETTARMPSRTTEVMKTFEGCVGGVEVVPIAGDDVLVVLLRGEELDGAFVTFPPTAFSV